MNDFLTWLSSNPVASTAITFTVGIIVLVVSILYIVAFFQGRDISFWPPSIGQKTNSYSKSSSSVTLKDRSEYAQTFEKSLSQAKNVALSGSNLVGVLTHYKGFIQAKAETGCKFRFLLTHPEFYPDSGKQTKAAKIETLNAFQILSDLSKNENIEYRVMTFQPQFSLLIVNPGISESAIQVEIYPYQSIASDRPHFLLYQKDNSKWYSFFYEQFETAWKNAQEYHQDESA
jgi:hypothetical protein